MDVRIYNRMKLLDKLKMSIERRLIIREFKFIYTTGSDYNAVMHFKTSQFTSVDLNFIFHFWGLNHQDWVKEWHVKSKSNKYMLVTILIKKFTSKKNCPEHRFIERSDWGRIYICNNCGLFSANWRCS